MRRRDEEMRFRARSRRIFEQLEPSERAALRKAVAEENRRLGFSGFDTDFACIREIEACLRDAGRSTT